MGVEGDAHALLEQTPRFFLAQARFVEQRARRLELRLVGAAAVEIVGHRDHRGGVAGYPFDAAGVLAARAHQVEAEARIRRRARGAHFELHGAHVLGERLDAGMAGERLGHRRIGCRGQGRAVHDGHDEIGRTSADRFAEGRLGIGEAAAELRHRRFGQRQAALGLVDVGLGACAALDLGAQAE